jgi:hypothetical protein
MYPCFNQDMVGGLLIVSKPKGFREVSQIKSAEYNPCGILTVNTCRGMQVHSDSLKKCSPRAYIFDLRDVAVAERFECESASFDSEHGRVIIMFPDEDPM